MYRELLQYLCTIGYFHLSIQIHVHTHTGTVSEEGPHGTDGEVGGGPGRVRHFGGAGQYAPADVRL